MLKIEIVENANQVETRNGTNKQTGAITAFYAQYGYAHLGGAFPVKMKIPLESPAMAYPVGEYQLALESFRIGRFDSLEVNPYNIKLVPINKGASFLDKKAG